MCYLPANHVHIDFKYHFNGHFDDLANAEYRAGL